MRNQQIFPYATVAFTILMILELRRERDSPEGIPSEEPSKRFWLQVIFLDLRKTWPSMDLKNFSRLNASDRVLNFSK